MKDIKVVFMGTPDFAVSILDMLVKNTNVVGVVTQPDKEVGRHKVLTASPVKEFALKNNIQIFQPIKIRNEYQNILDLKPDIIITCAYGQMLPMDILTNPRLGCINVHASLLPKLRGGAPIQHAIIDGLKETGITVMYMAEHMDDGDIIAMDKYMIKDNDTYGSLCEVLSKMGSELLLKVLPDIINLSNERIKQNSEEVTFAWNIKREEEHIDFMKSAKEVDQLVRGLNPFPYANTIIDNQEYKIIEGYYVIKNSTPNKINEVTKDAIGFGCIDGIYYATKIKQAGKKEMIVKDYLNGKNKDELINAEIK
jgi:methionyl-tRNA formyltransferase